MKELLKKILAKTPLYYPLKNWLTRRRQKLDLIQWEKMGRPLPPPHLFKQQNIKNFARRYNLKVLVETGTFYGEMLEAMKNTFDQLYSIELSEDLHKKAQLRFKKDRKIVLLQGDSGVELGKLISKIDQPALFYLDGHYSAGETARGVKDTPIFEELDHIFSAPEQGHVLIIDDARCFGTDPAYPSIEELSSYINKCRPSLEIEVKDDTIRITPGKN